jgi:hypothetical protein
MSLHQGGKGGRRGRREGGLHVRGGLRGRSAGAAGLPRLVPAGRWWKPPRRRAPATTAPRLSRRARRPGGRRALAAPPAGPPSCMARARFAPSPAKGGTRWAASPGRVVRGWGGQAAPVGRACVQRGRRERGGARRGRRRPAPCGGWRGPGRSTARARNSESLVAWVSRTSESTGCPSRHPSRQRSAAQTRTPAPVCRATKPFPGAGANIKPRLTSLDSSGPSRTCT